VGCKTGDGMTGMAPADKMAANGERPATGATYTEGRLRASANFAPRPAIPRCRRTGAWMAVRGDLECSSVGRA